MSITFLLYPVFKVQFSPLTTLSLALLKNLLGGGKQDRTADPLLARQVLSQLSYTPTIYLCLSSRFPPSKLSSTQVHSQSQTQIPNGGPRWTRTIDLTLIRRAL